MNVLDLVSDRQALRVIELRKGDVYLRIRKDYQRYTPVLGIVQTLGHNGSSAFVTALEFAQPEYSMDRVQIEHVVYLSDDDAPPNLFATTADEVAAHFATVLDMADSQIAKLRAELASAEYMRESIRVQSERPMTTPRTEEAL